MLCFLFLEPSTPVRSSYEDDIILLRGGGCEAQLVVTDDRLKDYGGDSMECRLRL